MNIQKHNYKEISSIDWERVTSNVSEGVNAKWNCRQRTIFLANLMIRKEVRFSICYGFYNKIYAHIWIEHRGKRLDPSIYGPKRAYYKVCEFRIFKDSKITRVICLLSRYVKKGGFL